MVGGRPPIPEVRTDFPLALGEELGLVGVIAILGLFFVVIERGLRIGAAAADDFRAILATGLALVIGVQAFIIAGGNLKECCRSPASRCPSSLRRLVAHRERDRGRAPPGAVRQGRRAATAARPRPPLARSAPTEAGRLMLATSSRRRPLGRTIVHVAIVLALAFGVLAGAGGYWAVIRSTELSHSPYDPAVIAASRTVPRGDIIDREGNVLTHNEKDANGELYRRVQRRRDQPCRRLRVAALRRASASSSPMTPNCRAWPAIRLRTRCASSGRTVRPQGSPSRDVVGPAAGGGALGSRRGAVVMIDPRDGEVLALASTPTYDASAVTNPQTSQRAFEALQEDPLPLLPRATLGRYVPGSVFKIVTAIAGLGSGAITPTPRTPNSRGPRRAGCAGGLPHPRRPPPQTGDKRLDLIEATEVSCNIYYALTGLATGGEQLVDYARRLGFGSPIPFDLPTAIAGHECIGFGARWVRRRRRARQRGLWAG